MEEILELPKQKIKASTLSPELMVVYSKYKQGKTTSLSYLDNCLILDLENGSNFVEALKIKINNAQDIRKYGDMIISQGKPYKYIAVDTMTALEDYALPVAMKLYQATPIGKNYGSKPGEDSILKLPNGAGYYWLRLAMENLLDYIRTLAPRIILSCHLKEKLITIDSKEVSSYDIDLTGKMRNIVCAKADAIGLIKREGNKTIISFKTNDLVSCGARPMHIRKKDIVLLESDNNGNIIKNGWKEIYID